MILSKLRSALIGRSPIEEIRLNGPYRLGTSRVRVLFEGVPIHIAMKKAGVELLIYPEILLDNSAFQPPHPFLLLDPQRCCTGINAFLRLEKPGDTLILGRHDKLQAAIFAYPPTMDLRRLSITHDGDALIFRALVSDTEIYLSPLLGKDPTGGILCRRRENLQKIRDIYGGPVAQLPPEEALSTLKQVNGILAQESFRPLDERGRPGGVVKLPEKVTPIIVGDLHAQVDNLLTLLSQNDFLNALETGSAALVILGDAIHSEEDGRLDEMDSSLLITDLILRLKLRFPQQVFYIRGNHDSFSRDVFKFGIAQCLVWEHAVRDKRGPAYHEEMKRFYDLLPYVLLSEGYVACHAAPIKTRFNMDMLVNIHRNPGLVRELTQNRLRRRNYVAGYYRSDVKHFRNTLGLPEHTPFLVSHSPLNREDAMWLEAGGIENHHIVFSANTPWIGLFTRVNKQMIPLCYHREDLLSLIDGLS